jgi:hypothetical protein
MFAEQQLGGLTHELHVDGLVAQAEAIAGFPANGATFGGSGPYASLIKQRHETEFHNHIHQLKSDVQSLSEEHKRRNVKADVADMHAKLHELRREMMLQDVRLDKTHMHIAEMRKKMDM